jgi:hypothetical protein
MFKKVTNFIYYFYSFYIIIIFIYFFKRMLLTDANKRFSAENVIDMIEKGGSKTYDNNYFIWLIKH